MIFPEGCFAGRPFAGRSLSRKNPTPARLAELKTMPYEEYLLTPEWQKKRWSALRWAGGRCEQCQSRYKLHVHHRTYERRGQEKMGDLMVLCADCHETEHLRQEIAAYNRQVCEHGEFYGS